MFEAFAEWLKEKVLPTLPTWGMLLLGVIAPVLIVSIAFALHADEHLKDTFAPLWFLALFSEFGKLVLTATIAGAVLRVLAVQGFFEEALTKIVFGEKGLDLMTQDRRIDLWKALTLRIHAPSIARKRNEARNEKFYSSLMEAEGRQIEYKENFYIEDVSREMTFSWEDEANGIVKVIEYMEATLVPFDESQEITWTSVRSVHGNRKLTDYTVSDLSIAMEGEIVSRRTVSTDKSGQLESKHHVLGGRSSYSIHRSRSQTWKLHDDPVLYMQADYIVEKGKFRISNQMKNARVLFQEIGGYMTGAPLFEPVTGGTLLSEGEETRRRISTVLLPRQGFQVIVLTST